MIGIYILIKGIEPIYIGRSTNVENRLYGHKDKDYDYYVIIPCKEHRLIWLESVMISFLNPSLNKNQKYFKPGGWVEYDYLKNFKTRRKLVLYPNGYDAYYLRGIKKEDLDYEIDGVVFVDTKKIA